MGVYEFFTTRVFPRKGRIYDFVLIRENARQRKPVFWHFLCSVCFSNVHHFLTQHNYRTGDQEKDVPRK